jgi:hypothetical protein
LPIEFLSEAAEITRPQRGIFATRNAAAYVDQLSRSERFSTPSSLRTGLVRRERTYISREQIFTLSWIDTGQELPAWFDQTMSGFADLLTLPANWDSYRAKPIDEPTVQKALELLDLLLGNNSPAPSVVPLASGGLQVEWHRAGQDLEIIFEPGANPEFFYMNESNGAEHSGSTANQLDMLRQLIRAIE